MRQHVLRLALSAMLVALSVQAAAQQSRKIPRVGYLDAHPLDGGLQPFFLQGLRDLGYTEGKNIVIEHRQAQEGEQEKIRSLAAELVRLQADGVDHASSGVVPGGQGD